MQVNTHPDSSSKEQTTAMTLVFNYEKVNNPEKAPFIPVHVSAKDGSMMIVRALIDSGADNIVMPKIIADVLGIESKELSKSEGIGGVVEVMKSKITATIKGETESHTLQLPIMVLKKDEGTVPMLLGRKGFFDHFHITFKHNHETIILEKTDF